MSEQSNRTRVGRLTSGPLFTEASALARSKHCLPPPNAPDFRPARHGGRRIASPPSKIDATGKDEAAGAAGRSGSVVWFAGRNRNRISVNGKSATAIVERNELLRDGLRLILAPTCHRPTIVESTLEHAALRGGAAAITLLLFGLADSPRASAQAQQARAVFPNARLVALAGKYEARCAREVMQAGANAYLLKTIPPDPLVKALDLIAAGWVVLSPR